MKMFLSGSEALAQAVKLCKVDLMSAYPITPNTPALMAMSDLIKAGEMDTVNVNAESELGSMLIVAGAAATGLRTFNCTAAQGLALMKEPLWMASGMALPVVFGIASRQLGSPQGLLSDFSDCLAERDASVVQFICETHQEVIDNLIMAYRVCENEKVLLPGFVVYEGFRLSHAHELVDVPDPEQVQEFLPPYRPTHAFIDTNYPITQGAGAFNHYYGTKFQQYRAMQEAKPLIMGACRDFYEIFGRCHPGLIETYRTEDADLIIVGMGTLVTILRELVDEFRDRGIKIGLLKIRVYRPFPEEEIVAALEKAPHTLVIDRAVTPGMRGGISFVEIASCLRNYRGKISNYIIGGNDVGLKEVREIIQDTLAAKEPFIKWHGEIFEQGAAQLTGFPKAEALKSKSARAEEIEKTETAPACGGCGSESLMAQGTTTCSGCVSLTALRLCLSEFDQDTVVTNNAGCLMAASAIYPITAFRVPHLFFTYSNAGAAASGIEAALRKQGKETKVFLFGGDGGMFDIGLQTFSAALERGHQIVYMCYDNEGYMNTGVQRSSSTPQYAKTKTTPDGKLEKKKNIMKIVEAHGNVYAATASPAYPKDLQNKIKKAIESKKPAFIHVQCPCPPGWDMAAEKGIEVARLGVETNFFPLYEYDNGVVTVRKNRKPKQIQEYLKLQGRFQHLSEEEIRAMQLDVDAGYQELLLREELSEKAHQAFSKGSPS